MFRPWLKGALVAAVLSYGSPAYAGDPAVAEALFREGRSLMNAGKFAAACPKLAESHKQDPATGTLLALAMCQEKLGKTASAWANFSEVATRARRDGRADREQAARERMQALEPRLSHVTINVDESTARLPDLVVTQNGAAVGPGAWGVAVPLDPGQHVVEAKAPGKKPWNITITVAKESEKQTVQVPALEDAPVPDDPIAVAPTSDPSPTPTDHGPVQEPSGSSPLPTIGLVVGGVGLVGLGIGAGFGIRAKGLNDDSNRDGLCNDQNQCDPEGGRKRDDAIRSAGISTGAFVAGGVLTAVGVTLFAVGTAKKKKAARFEATPIVGRSGAAMLLRGRF